MAEWFRSWHGAPTDPKWRTIAKRSNSPTSLVVSVAWCLFDRASQADDRGTINGADPETIADFLDAEPQQVSAIIDAMHEKGVLEGDRFTAWEKRQPQREGAPSTHRVQQFRARQKEALQGVSSDMKRDETQRNALKRSETLEESRGDKTENNDKRSSSTTPREPAAAATAALDGFIGKSHYDEIEAALRDAAGYENNPAPGLFTVGPILSLIEEGFDLQRDILPTVRSKAKQLSRPAGSWNYFIGAIREAKAKAAKSAPASASKPPKETTAEFLAKYAGEKASIRLSVAETLPDVTDDDRRALLAEVLKDAKIDLETERGRRWMAQILLEGRDSSALSLSITGPERGRIINTYGRLLLGEGWRERELALLDAERKANPFDPVAIRKKHEPAPSTADDWNDFDDLPAGFAQAGAGA